MNIQDRLSHLYKRVYASKKTVVMLKTVDRVSVVFSVLIFIALIYLAFCRGIMEGVKLAVLAGMPFIIVSALRMVFKSERPYEMIDFGEISPELPHRKRGSSFPSRHVFSAFLVAVLAFEYVWYLGAVGVALGIALAITRVLLGIHFTKDVVCGAAIGIISGVIGIIIL